MNEIAETNKLLKKAVKSTYKKLISVPKEYPKKTPNNMKASMKTMKTLNFIRKITKDNTGMDKIPKRKNDSNDRKKNVTSKPNTVSEIQVSDSDQSMEIQEMTMSLWDGEASQTF